MVGKPNTTKDGAVCCLWDQGSARLLVYFEHVQGVKVGSIFSYLRATCSIDVVKHTSVSYDILYYGILYYRKSPKVGNPIAAILSSDV